MWPGSLLKIKIWPLVQKRLKTLCVLTKISEKHTAATFTFSLNIGALCSSELLATSTNIMRCHSPEDDINSYTLENLRSNTLKHTLQH